MRPPQSWRAARVTLAIAGITALAYLLVEAVRAKTLATIWGAFIPVRVGGIGGDEGLAPVFLTPVTATLLHGDLLHLAFNLLILVFCGRSVEPVIGGRGLVILYLVGAYAAAAGHLAVWPTDRTPMIGASGAVSAVLGAYALLFGRNRVRTANPRLGLWLNVLWLAAAWVALQLLVGAASGTVAGLQIAIAAHIGGFIAGLLLVKPLLLLHYRNA